MNRPVGGTGFSGGKNLRAEPATSSCIIASQARAKQYCSKIKRRDAVVSPCLPTQAISSSAPAH
jgi:hypothetical protein